MLSARVVLRGKTFGRKTSQGYLCRPLRGNRILGSVEVRIQPVTVSAEPRRVRVEKVK